MTGNLVGSIEVTCKWKLAKIVLIRNPIENLFWSSSHLPIKELTWSLFGTQVSDTVPSWPSFFFYKMFLFVKLPTEKGLNLIMCKHIREVPKLKAYNNFNLLTINESRYYLENEENNLNELSSHFLWKIGKTSQFSSNLLAYGVLKLEIIDNEDSSLHICSLIRLFTVCCLDRKKCWCSQILFHISIVLIMPRLTHLYWLDCSTTTLCTSLVPIAGCLVSFYYYYVL